MTTQAQGKIAYRPKEVARATGLSDDTIGRAIRNGDLQSLKIGSARLVTHEALQDWLGRHAEATV